MKKIKKTVIAIFLVIVTIMTVFVLPITTVEAKTKVKLSKTSLTLYVGSTKMLKLSNAKSAKIKWSSTKKSVAKVSSKGKITAKKKGTTFIKAKYKGKTYKCKVNVKSRASTKTTVYITPTGKCYHYNSKCGGKNSFSIDFDSAKSRGLSPCKKCAQ